MLSIDFWASSLPGVANVHKIRNFFVFLEAYADISEELQFLWKKRSKTFSHVSYVELS